MPIRLVISENILKEGKEDFLKNQYITTGKQIDTSTFNEIDEEIFNKIYQADPFNGKYATWLLNLYKYKQLKLEDLYKAEEYLTLFDKVKNKLPNKDLLARNGKEYVYPSLASLYKTIQPFEEYKSNSELKREVKKNESKRIYEDSEFLVIAPLTENAACYYGSGTKWCTASEKDNMFNYYNKEGQLYIIINKQRKRKFQFHQNEEQLMDENDSPVDWNIITNDFKKLNDIFKVIVKGEYIFGYKKKKGVFNENITVKPMYDYITPYTKLNLYRVRLDNLVGLINSEGKTVVDLKYTEMDFVNDEYVIVRDEKTNYGVISLQSYKTVLPLEFKDIYKVHDNPAIIISNGKFALYDMNFNPVTKFIYDNINYVGGNFLKVKNNEKYGLIDMNGKVLVDTKYNEIIHASSNIYVLRSDNGKQSLYDASNNKLID